MKKIIIRDVEKIESYLEEFKENSFIKTNTKAIEAIVLEHKRQDERIEYLSDQNINLIDENDELKEKLSDFANAIKTIIELTNNQTDER